MSGAWARSLITAPPAPCKEPGPCLAWAAQDSFVQQPRIQTWAQPSQLSVSSRVQPDTSSGTGWQVGR